MNSAGNQTPLSLWQILGVLIVPASLFVVTLTAMGSEHSATSTGPVPDTTDRQTRIVRIIHADSSVGLVHEGERVRRLLGNVHLRHEETDLWAAEAMQYLARDEIIFEGQVRIVEEQDTLEADRVFYNSSSKRGRAEGNVRLSDGEAVASAPSGLYYVRDKRAEFYEGVVLRDSTSVLTSTAGRYWTEEKRAEFYDDVHLQQDRSDIRADSLTHFRDSDRSLAYGRVFITQYGETDEGSEDQDTTVVTYLFGDSAHHDNRVEYSLVEGGALLMRLEADTAGVDTLFIRAERFENSRTDSLQRLIVTNDVHIWQNRFAARADSAVYDRVEHGASRSDDEVSPGPPALIDPAVGDLADSARYVREAESGSIVPGEGVRLFQNPTGWMQDSQITGDSMRIVSRENMEDSLYVFNNAFVVSLDTTLQRLNQLKGHNLDGMFDREELRMLHVGPNAEAIYFVRNGDDELEGGVQMSADSITFWFNENEVYRIRAVRDPEGVFYDPEAIPEPFQLEGFRWTPEEKPLKERFLEDERLGPVLRQEPFITLIPVADAPSE